MNAFIYAAGRGNRMGKLVQERNKVLFEFAGKSLLEWHVLRLKAVGAKRIFVVTGYRYAATEAAISDLASRYQIEVIPIRNPDYEEGSLLSLALSLPDVEQSRPFALLMDGDVLYDGQMLPRLLDSPEPTALLIDRGFSAADDDPVIVPVKNGRPFDLVKRWRGETTEVGESIGFFKIAEADIPALAAATRSRLVGEGRMDSYDEIFRDLVRDGLFGRVDVTGLPWVEIDFPWDVDFATHKVTPQILATDAEANQRKQTPVA